MFVEKKSKMNKQAIVVLVNDDVDSLYLVPTKFFDHGQMTLLRENIKARLKDKIFHNNDFDRLDIRVQHVHMEEAANMEEVANEIVSKFE